MFWFQTSAPATCLFTRLEESSLVPVSAENVIYEALFVGNLLLLLLLPSWRKGEVFKSYKDDEWPCLHFFSSPLKQQRETPSLFSHQNKGYINYVFAETGLSETQARLL